MSNEIKCSKCGSVYVEYKDTEEKKEGTYKNYYCQSCQKSFPVFIERKLPSGKIIATVYGDQGRCVEIYKDQEGNVGTVSGEIGKKYATEFHAPRFYSDLKTELSTKDKIYGSLTIDTFSHKNDKNGTLFSVRKILLDNECIKEALLNDAMRAAYREEQKVFDFKDNHNYKMLTDVAVWLNSFVGVPLEKKEEKNIYNTAKEVSVKATKKGINAVGVLVNTVVFLVLFGLSIASVSTFAELELLGKLMSISLILMTIISCPIWKIIFRKKENAKKLNRMRWVLFFVFMLVFVAISLSMQ